jgi:hypothetical protein
MIIAIQVDVMRHITLLNVPVPWYPNNFRKAVTPWHKPLHITEQNILNEIFLHILFLDICYINMVFFVSL